MSKAKITDNKTLKAFQKLLDISKEVCENNKCLFELFERLEALERKRAEENTNASKNE